MAYAKWKNDRNRRRVLVARWRDKSAPGGWREERRPNDRSKEQARDYAREREKRADLLAKGLDVEAAAPITFGEMWDRWWEDEGKHRRGASTGHVNQFFLKHLADLRASVLMPATAREFAAALEKRLKAKEPQLSPKSLNHLRDGVFGIFEHARDYKVNLWRNENPIQWVKRRKVPRRRYETLRRDQIRFLLAALPAPHPEHQGIASPWRWAAAISLYTGARPGEVFGLYKSDVDLQTGVIVIQHSWEAPLPKNGRWRPVLIVPELRPYLEEMLRSSPGKFLLPRQDGRIYEDTVRWQLVDHLRRALVKIGDVVGWDHTCRRCKRKAGGQPAASSGANARGQDRSQGNPEVVFRWRHADGDQRLCPTCGMKLWASPIPRPVRFYDLRHTSATIMRNGGAVDLGGVQKTLGHSSPEITASIYDHSELEGHRAAIERALTFNAPEPAPEAETSPADAGGCTSTLPAAHTEAPAAPSAPGNGAPVGAQHRENEKAPATRGSKARSNKGLNGRGDRI